MPSHCAGRLTASDVRMRENYVTKGIPKTSLYIMDETVTPSSASAISLRFYACFNPFDEIYFR